MLPLGLSMLWEPVDAAAALAERFGFDSFDAAARWATAMLAETWGIGVDGCSRLVISGPNAIVWVATDRGDLVVKWSRAPERFASLAAATRVLGAVAGQGIPVAAPIAAVDRTDRVTLDGPSGPLSIAVLPELTGDWLNVDDASAVRAAGACLADLHRAFGSVSHDGPTTAAPADDLRQRIAWWLANSDRGLAPEASRRLADLLSTAPELDDQPQLVHNDFRAGNILMRGSTVVGVLDFDEVAVQHRVGDLAKASTYLGTMFTDWRPITPAVRRTFVAGYESVRPLGPAERWWLDILVLWQGIIAIPGPDDPDGWADAVRLQAVDS